MKEEREREPRGVFSAHWVVKAFVRSHRQAARSLMLKAGYTRRVMSGCCSMCTFSFNSLALLLHSCLPVGYVCGKVGPYALYLSAYLRPASILVSSFPSLSNVDNFTFRDAFYPLLITHQIVRFLTNSYKKIENCHLRCMSYKFWY